MNMTHFKTHSLFMFISQSLDSVDPIDFFMPLCMMTWSFIIMFCNCEVGQSMDNQFLKLSNDIYKCDWFCLPHKLQRMFIIIIMNAQPVLIYGFGNVVCSRESFKRVRLHSTENHKFLLKIKFN